MFSRFVIRRAILALATAMVLMVVPAAANAAPAATLGLYTWGWCCGNSAQDLDGVFRASELQIINTGDTVLTLDTLRVTFNPTQYRWETDIDADDTNSRVYAGYDDGVEWTDTFDYAPLSSVPAACTQESATASVVVYACDLENSTIPLGGTGWTGVKALLPAAGFKYGAATATYEVSFVGAPISPLSASSVINFNAGDSNLKTSGGYLGNPDLVDLHETAFRDFDAEATGVNYAAGDVVPYRIRLQNPQHPTDPTDVAHGVSVEFRTSISATYEDRMEFQSAGVAATGGLTVNSCAIKVADADEQTWRCTFNGDIPVDGTSMITIPIKFIDSTATWIEFDVETVNGTINRIDDPEEETFGDAPVCQLPRFFGSMSGARYQMFGVASIAALEAGGPIRYELPCSEPEAAPLTNFSSTVGIWNAMEGYANTGPHLGTVRGPNNSGIGSVINEPVAPGPDGRYAFTWEKAGLSGLTPGTILDTYRIAARPLVGGDYYRILFHVTVEQQSDLRVALTGTPALTVAASGSDATYTATVTNDGPDAAPSSRVKFQLPASATYVSSSAAAGGDACSNVGTLVTCTIANLASGQSRMFSAVARYQAGVSGLVMPTLAATTATTQLLGSGARDPLSTNNTATATTSLTAQAITPTTCATGQTGTPPNCVTPSKTAAIQGTKGNDKITGTSGNDIIRAGAGNDRVTGGFGNDAIGGGSGNDVLDGGVGNDRLFGGLGRDLLLGGAGQDRLFGGAGNDRSFGGSGNDALYGEAGNDAQYGGTGKDIVSGGSGNDYLRGGTGDDVIRCGSGIDKAYGDSGDDVIGCADGAGGDLIVGGPGTDLCIGNVGDRFLSCERIIRL